MEAAIFCLAQALYFEARSEPIAEQLMVANVIMNRVASKRYPDDVCDVIWEKGWDRKKQKFVAQFSYTLDGKPETIGNPNKWAESLYWANWYLNHPYKYNYACNYHADYVDPGWSYKLVYKGKTHLFYEGGC